MDDAIVLSIVGGGSTKPQKHVFEELICVLQGRLATTVWQRNGPKRSFEWQTECHFAIPQSGDPVGALCGPQGVEPQV